MNPPSLDLVLPCYNPQPGWAQRVIQSYAVVAAALRREPGLILVNDGSSFGVTADDLRALNEAIPRFQYLENERNRGKGFTLRAGVMLASADYIVYTDIDFPYTEESLLGVHAALKGGAQVAAGVKDEAYYQGVPALRRLISRVLRLMIRSLLRLEISDTQCGLKGFDRAGRSAFLATSIDRYLFDLEFLFLAYRQFGLKVQAVPVQLKPGISFSRMRPQILVQEGANFLRIWLRSWRGTSAEPNALVPPAGTPPERTPPERKPTDSR
ncbi:MAG: glycosyltransferase [Bacteroidetes bacterium]|nr:glycosyltransferase [Bacteroidota bacterium]